VRDTRERRDVDGMDFRLVSLLSLVPLVCYAVVRLQPALFMNASATITDLLLRRAFGQQARPSDPHRTARVRIGSSRLRVLVSRRRSAISRRTVMNNAG